MSDPGGITPAPILFVCTGNTCRSPLAEAICKRMLAERLGCDVAELADRGYSIGSAGVAAVPGMSATPEAIRVAGESGADLGSHHSRRISPEALRKAREIVVMTRAHQELVGHLVGEGGPPVRLLRADGSDLIDPIGGDLSVYRDCAETIRRELERFVGGWKSA